MLRNFNKLKLTRTPRLFVLMLLILLGCKISALAQSYSNYEVVELINVNVLQIDIPAIKHSHSDKLNNWTLLEGNASIVVQIGNINHALLEQIRGAGNVAKALQQGHYNRIGFEYTDKKECGIYQSGSRNYTEVKQFANQNTSETFQYGNSNETNIVQHGARGFMIDYKSYANKSIVTQNGNGNSATITQTFYP